MYSITKQFRFEAAHSLPYLPDGHKCRNPHGHSYRVELVLEASALSPTGFVRDFGDLDNVKRFLDLCWDHSDLNMAARLDLGPPQTTSEALARWLYERFKAELPELTAVRVSETANTWASYSEAP